MSRTSCIYLASIILKSNSKGSGCEPVQDDDASFIPVGLHQFITIEKGQVVHIYQAPSITKSRRYLPVLYKS